MASLAGNGSCIESYRRISITSAVLNVLNYQEVKFNLKSYAYGPSISCGGFLYGVPGVSFTAPASMFKTYNSIEWQKLSTCSSGADSFHLYTANYDLHFSYSPPGGRLVGGFLKPAHKQTQDIEFKLIQ